MPRGWAQLLSRDQYAHRILTQLESGGHASQRSLSRDVGIALGLTNVLLRELVRKGWVSVSRLDQNRVRYVLTSAGLAEKVRLSRQVFQNSIRFYAQARDRIAERFSQISAELSVRADAEAGAGNGTPRDKPIVFYDAGEVAEIGYICLQRTDLRLVGVVDDRVAQFLSVPVFPRHQLSPEGLAGNRYLSVVVMSFGEADETRRTLEELKIPADRISWL